MKLTSNNMKKLLLLITFGILLFLGLSHIQPVLSSMCLCAFSNGCCSAVPALLTA